MKKHLSIVLFSIFLLKIGALALLLEVCRETLRKQMAQEISNKSYKAKAVETLAFDYKTYRYLIWEKANKEFWFKSQLYDVISVNHSGEKIFVRCINDTEEKKFAVALHFLNFKCKNHTPISQAGKIIIQVLLQPIHPFSNNYDELCSNFTMLTMSIPELIEKPISGLPLGVFVPPKF